jgi:hypothetical protein
MLDTAYRYMKVGDLSTSKDLYQRIITKYEGTMLQDYVKTAELGLETIKVAGERAKEIEKQQPQAKAKSTKGKR